MDIVINVVETASELAYEALLKYVSRVVLTDDRKILSETVLEEKENGDLGYKEPYQEIFNNFYDEYFEFLTNASVPSLILTCYDVKNILEVNNKEACKVLDKVSESKLAKISLTRIIVEIGIKLGFKTK